MTVIRTCCKCAEEVFRGEQDLSEHMEIYGNYYPGCGECPECERDLCSECGELEDGICGDCRERKR